MNDLLRQNVGRSGNIFEATFTGNRFADALENYGQDTLVAMFGPELTRDLHRLARVTRLINSKSSMTSGLVAANIALHPVKHMGKLIELKVLQELMTSPTGVKWLTTGLEAPNTRRGAEALTRLSLFAAALGDEKTGTTPFTPITPP